MTYQIFYRNGSSTRMEALCWHYDHHRDRVIFLRANDCLILPGRDIRGINPGYGRDILVQV